MEPILLARRLMTLGFPQQVVPLHCDNRRKLKDGIAFKTGTYIKLKADFLMSTTKRAGFLFPE